MPILFIRYGNIGDVILDTPLLREAKRLFKEEIFYLTSRAPSQVLELNPYIDRVFKRENEGFVGLISKLRKLRITHVFDLQHNLSSNLLVLLSGARWRVGVKKHGYEVYNVKIEQDFTRPYTVFHRLDFLKPFGFEGTADIELDFPVEEWRLDKMEKWLKDRAGNFNILLNPLTPNPLKNWGLGNYRVLAEKISSELKAKVFWSCHPEDRETLLGLVEDIEDNYLIPPTPNLRDLGAFLTFMDLYVGADTGVKHLAVARRIPTFTIFTVTPPEVWTPPNNYHGYFRKRTPCSPCWQRKQCPLRTYDCLKASPDEVFVKLRDFLKSHPVLGSKV